MRADFGTADLVGCSGRRTMVPRTWHRNSLEPDDDIRILAVE